jgi:hypothetical protein
MVVYRQTLFMLRAGHFALYLPFLFKPKCIMPGLLLTSEYHAFPMRQVAKTFQAV